ncbi:MAG: alkaline phosphatase family protein [Deltaproteobacteria bacterium]|nr:alkaline phosphatase family protein [Deltaproteobacteria bacterium]
MIKLPRITAAPILCAVFVAVCCGSAQTANPAAVPARAKAPAKRGTVDKAPLSAMGKKRAACTFGPGDLPAATLDESMPTGSRIPIDHFIVVMQENRSFDHYFEGLPAFGQPDVDVAPPSYVNPLPGGSGAAVKPFLLETPCVADLPHTWPAVHAQYARGKMNGFAKIAMPDGQRSVGHYDARILNYYYALASTFALADHYHADVPGPTWPNRMFFLAASSFGHVDNTPPPVPAEERSIFHELEAKGRTWAIYAESYFFEKHIFPRLIEEKGHHFKTMNDFYADARAGRLPDFSWVESTIGGSKATDEHPPANVQLGQSFVANVVAALFASPDWPRSALFWTYDEHGGFFDHVPPPRACTPDAIEPIATKGKVEGRFDMLGFRVPFVVVSPFSRAHHVSHRTYSHASALRLVEARFDLPALSRRDANAEPPFDLFDFASPRFLTPPKLPEPKVDEAARIRCAKEHGEYVDPDDAGGNNPLEGVKTGR